MRIQFDEHFIWITNQDLSTGFNKLQQYIIPEFLLQIIMRCNIKFL